MNFLTTLARLVIRVCIIAFVLSLIISFIPLILVLILLYAFFAPARFRSTMFNLRNNKFRYRGGTPPPETARNPEDDAIDVECTVIDDDKNGR